MARARQTVVNPYRSAAAAQGRRSERVCGMNPGVLLMMALLTLVLCMRLHDTVNPHGRLLGNISGMQQHPGVESNDDGTSQYLTHRRASHKKGAALSHKTMRKIEKYQREAAAAEADAKADNHKLQEIVDGMDQIEDYAAVKARHAAALAASRATKQIAETWGLEEVKPAAHHAAVQAQKEADGTALSADKQKLAEALGKFYESIHVTKTKDSLNAIANDWRKKPDKLRAALQARYKKSPFEVEDILFHERE